MEYEIIEDLNNMSLEDFMHKWKGICIEGTFWHKPDKKYMVFNTNENGVSENETFGSTIKEAIENYIIGMGPNNLMQSIRSDINMYNESMRFDIEQNNNTMLK